MRKQYLIYLFSITFCSLAGILGSPLKAQRIIEVEPGVGTLNQAVDGDTTETGERIDSLNTIYRLQKDGFYLLTGTLTNRGWTLQIDVEEGEGARPVLQPAVVSGGESSGALRPRGDVYLSGLYITNEDELGGPNLRILRCSADGIRVVVDDCHLDKAGQSALRLDNPGMKIYITNSVISNIGQPLDPNNGRAIDDRGNDIDSLVLENNTFYNLTSNILRDGGASVINYLWYNQNTAAIIGQRGLEMGTVVDLTITNNVFVNAGFFGTFPSAEEGDFDRKLINLDAPDSVEQTVTITNNNFYLDTATIASQYPDSVFAVPVYSEAAKSFADTTNDLSEALEFVNGPSVDSLATIVFTFYNDPDPGSNTPPFDAGDGGVANQLPFDFKYQDDAVSATASTDAGPLGDLNWWDIAPPPTSEPRIVLVEPGVGTLNQAVDGDTTETGERIDSLNTIYRLQKDGFYLLTGTLTNRGWTLQIDVEEGEGARPVLQPAVVSGGESSGALRPRGDVYLSGLYITNEDELGGPNLRILRCSADGIRVVVDDCHLDKAGQSALRLDNPGMKIYITNSVISNIGQPLDPNNGRAIDDRGNDIDSLVLENNTFYNLTSNILRDGGASVINYLWYNQNTAAIIGQRGLEMGTVVDLTITNNVFVNAGFFGTFPSAEEGDFDRKLINLDAPDSVEQTVTITNNNFYLDTATIASQYPDSVFAVPVYSEAAKSFADTTNDLSEALEFVNGPSVDSLATIVFTFYNDPDPGSNTPPFDAGDGGVANQLPFDFKYQDDAVSATASTDAGPLGDLNWWDGVSTSLRDKLAFTETSQLYNYPNPFDGVTTISFNMKEAHLVNISVFNSLGQQVAQLAERTFATGDHKLTWNARNLPDGMYILRVEVGKEVATRKLMLGR